MPLAKYMKLAVLMGLLAGMNMVTQTSAGITVYTAHVEWVGYDFNSDTNCGDGTGNTCENKLKVKRTTSSSCSSRSWTEGSYENNMPEASDLTGYYELKWAKVDIVPCLTFDFKITENSAGDSSSQHTVTIRADGTHLETDFDLVLGTANGDFRIEYWLTSVYFPILGPSQ